MNKKLPINKINLKGIIEKDTKPSKAREIDPKKLNFASPAFLSGLSY